jgi:hypothetical protein
MCLLAALGDWMKGGSIGEERLDVTNVRMERKPLLISPQDLVTLVYSPIAVLAGPGDTFGLRFRIRMMELGLNGPIDARNSSNSALNGVITCRAINSCSNVIKFQVAVPLDQDYGVLGVSIGNQVFPLFHRPGLVLPRLLTSVPDMIHSSIGALMVHGYVFSSFTAFELRAYFGALSLSERRAFADMDRMKEPKKTRKMLKVT